VGVLSQDIPSAETFAPTTLLTLQAAYAMNAMNAMGAVE
jgi:hypothetical protein